MGEIVFEQPGEFGDHFRVRRVEVIRFAGIGGEIVELDGRQALLLRVGVAGFSSAAGAGVKL